MKRLVLILFSLLCVLSPAWSKGNDALRRLDAELEKKRQYDALKEARIDSLRKQAFKSEEERYSLAEALYDEYASYNYDSAYAYANRLREIAAAIGDKDRLVRADCSKIFCLLSAGFFNSCFGCFGKTVCRNFQSFGQFAHAQDFDAFYVMDSTGFLQSFRRYFCSCFEQFF
mgnify:CR=1 FL=1